MSTLIEPVASPELAAPPQTKERPIADAWHDRLKPALAEYWPSRPINWKLWKARILYWLWTLFTKLMVTIIYLYIVSQAIAFVFSEMGTRFSKVPGFAFLDNYEATYRITIAHVFAIVPLLSTWILWSLILRMFVSPAKFADRFNDYAIDRLRRVILVIGVIVIIADAALFAASFSMSSWGEARLSATAVLATGMYCAVIAFVSLVSMFLGDAVTAIKEKEVN